MKLKKNHIIIGGTILCIAAVYGAVLPTKARPFDERTEKVLSELEPATALKARRFLDAARKAGIDLRAISGRRTCAQQDQLYAQGRTAPGNIVTKASFLCLPGIFSPWTWKRFSSKSSQLAMVAPASPMDLAGVG